jgi:WD40 repeat protein
MAAAEKSLRLNQSQELRRWLDAAPRDHRGWEWDYLDAISDTSRRAVAAVGTPTRIAIAPGASLVATVEDRLVRLWSLPALEPLRSVEGHTDAIYRAEFNHDASRLVTVSRDVSARAWDVATGREISRIELANPAFAAATFHPDGATAATCAWERVDGQVHGVVWIWDTSSGAVRTRQRVGVKPLSSIRFTPDGRHLLAGSWDGLVHVLDPAAIELRRLALRRDDVYNAVNDIAVSPDGALVAAAAKDRNVHVFRIADGECLAILRGHEGYVEGLAFAPDGLTLASTSADSTARLWSVRDWSAAGVLRGHQSTVRGAAWFAGGADLLTCSSDRTLRVWDASAPAGLQLDISAGVEGTYSASLGGDVVTVACHDGWLRRYDAQDGALISAWEAHPGSTCHAAGPSADGTRVITASWDGTGRVWEAASGTALAVLEAGRGVYAAALSPDGSRAALSAGPEVQVWDVDPPRLIHRFTVDEQSATRLDFSPDGIRLASGWSDGMARVHDADRGALVATLGGHGGRVEAVAFARGGQAVVTGDAEGVVRLFPAGGGPAAFAVDTGERGVNHVAASADRIAAATDRLWIIDLRFGGLILDRQPHADGVWHLSWSADGSRLATCATNGTIAVLDASTSRRRLAGRLP